MGGPMTAGFFFLGALIYLAFHFGAGTVHHRYRKAAGLNPRLYASLGRGCWASVRVPGTGFRVSHRL